MYLEILTPERVVLRAEVSSVTLPGVEGGFQLLDHHAPVVSLLTQGMVKINGDLNVLKADTDFFDQDLFTKDAQQGQWLYQISGGLLEMSANRVIVLAD